MVGELICVATLALGIDVGWQRLPEGGMEYLIQLEPEVLETLRTGGMIQSDIPPSLGAIRAYRITVGSEELPRETPPPAPAESPVAAEQPAPAQSPQEPPVGRPLVPSEGNAPSPAPRPSLDLPWPGPGGVGTGPSRPAPGATGPSLPTETVPSSPSPPLPAVPTVPTPSPSAPGFLPEELRREPLEAEPAVFNAPQAPASESTAAEPAGDLQGEEERSKPWGALLATLFGLFASIGGNFYLGWLALGFRSRYRGVLQRVHEAA